MPFKDVDKHREYMRERVRRQSASSHPSQIEAWGGEPKLFLKENFGVEVWSKQAEILNSVRDNDRTTVRSGNATGKSFTASGCMLWFLYCFYPSIVLTTAPTYRQVRDIIWREAARMYNRHPNMGGDFFLQTTRLNLEPEWYALGLSSDEPDKFQGYHSENILIIVDEPSGVEEFIFEAIEGIMAGGNAKLLLIGNPMSMSGTYRDSHLDGGKAQFYNQIHISAMESPNVKEGRVVIPGLATRKWIDERKEDWGEDNPLYQIRVMGEFADQGIDTLINLDWINKAIKRYDQNEKKAEGQKVLGVDVARFGDDETVYGIRQGDRLVKIGGWAKWDTMKTSNWLNQIIIAEGPDCGWVDVIGIGSGVVDRIRELGHKHIKGVNVSEKAKDEKKFINRRAEIFWQLRERFQRGDIEIPNDGTWIAKLSGLKYEFDNSGRLKMESKEDMKKRGVKSPDRADMLAITFMENRKKLAWAWG